MKCCSEALVKNYDYRLHNNAEEHSSQTLRMGLTVCPKT